MTDTWLDISTTFKDAAFIQVARAFDAQCQAQGTPYFLIGAMARDLILQYGYNATHLRATRDFDFAVQVGSWPDFQCLKAGLCALPGWTPTSQSHRLHVQFGDHKLEVDIVPFGAIEDAQGTFTWPPNHDQEMNVLGFNCILESVRPIRVSADPVLELPVPPLEAIALLKLIAWQDRRHLDSKDAIDLLAIISHYEVWFDDDIDPIDTNYPELNELPTAIHHLGAPYLLGRRARALCNDAVMTVVGTLLEKELDEANHPGFLVRQARGPDPDSTLELLKAFADGFGEGTWLRRKMA